MKKLLFLAVLLLAACQKDYYLEDLQQAEFEIQQLQSISDAKTDEINNLQEIINTINADLNAAQEHIVAITSDLAEVNKERDLLQIDVDRLVGIVVNKEEEIDSLLAQTEVDSLAISNLNDEVASLETALANVETIAANRLNRITELENAEPTVVTVTRVVQGPARIVYITESSDDNDDNDGDTYTHTHSVSDVVSGTIKITFIPDATYELPEDRSYFVFLYHAGTSSDPVDFRTNDGTGEIYGHTNNVSATSVDFVVYTQEGNQQSTRREIYREPGITLAWPASTPPSEDCSATIAAPILANNNADFRFYVDIHQSCSAWTDIRVTESNGDTHSLVAIRGSRSNNNFTVAVTEFTALDNVVVEVLNGNTATHSSTFTLPAVPDLCEGITASKSFNNTGQFVVTLNVPSGCTVGSMEVDGHPSVGQSSIVDPVYLTNGESYAVKAYSGSNSSSDLVWTGSVTYEAQVTDVTYNLSANSASDLHVSTALSQSSLTTSATSFDVNVTLSVDETYKWKASPNLNDSNDNFYDASQDTTTWVVTSNNATVVVKSAAYNSASPLLTLTITPNENATSIDLTIGDNSSFQMTELIPDFDLGMNYNAQSNDFTVSGPATIEDVSPATASTFDITVTLAANKLWNTDYQTVSNWTISTVAGYTLTIQSVGESSGGVLVLSCTVTPGPYQTSGSLQVYIDTLNNIITD